MIAKTRSTFRGSTLDDLGRAGPSVAFDASFRGGAVTGRVGNALDQNGSNVLNNLW